MDSQKNLMLALFVFSLVATSVKAADPDPLQDFYIADLSPKPGCAAHMNGYPCKDPATATAQDFIYKGLQSPTIITPTNPWGANAKLDFARHWPALNTLGVFKAVRLDLIPGGVIAPHTHNLATEIVFVTSGELYIGFVANSDDVNNNNNKLFAGTVKKAGEAFLFGALPPVDPATLARSFWINQTAVTALKGATT
ncbi:hypothetical protein Mapa_011711 [Marchantia paleacea]|nr:hypothetical protein Mapa_011711 [Marchantia paleacea]